MIKTKNDLKEYIKADNTWLDGRSKKQRIIDLITSPFYKKIKCYLTLLRKSEYHLNNSKGSRFHTYLYWFYEGKKSRLGQKLSIEIGPNCFEKGLQIWHTGIVVNTDVKAGENCILHGGNCIGNNGGNNNVPKIGNNVDVGFGAVIIGDVTVGDNTKIGANAVVTKDVEPNTVVAGVPAIKIR